MDKKLFIEMDEGNQKELLRIYKHNLESAKTDADKDRWTKKVAEAEAEISKLEAEEKAL